MKVFIEIDDVKELVRDEIRNGVTDRLIRLCGAIDQANKRAERSERDRQNRIRMQEATSWPAYCAKSEKKDPIYAVYENHGEDKIAAIKLLRDPDRLTLEERAAIGYPVEGSGAYFGLREAKNWIENQWGTQIPFSLGKKLEATGCKIRY